MVALYIHWPFCKAKCPYCDFNSHVREGVDQARWKQALLTELRHMAAWMPGETLSSIFFGGGTPSLMPPETAEALIDEAGRLFSFDAHIEITLEANPTSAEAAGFKAFAAAGVNRVSLGVQSLKDASLAFLGREHSAKEALQAVALAQQSFTRTSFDLIYALPNQSASSWESELTEALTYADKHLSLYQLTIEPNTAFHHLYHRKKAFRLPKDTLARDLFLITQQIMEDAGLPAYEISNHAAAGEASRHNLTYWQGGAYLGVGAGAHGRVFSGKFSLPDGSDKLGRPLSRAHGYDAHALWHATATLKSPERWLELVEQRGHGVEEMLPLDDADRAQEQILTGLRLREGIALSDAVQAQLDRNKVERYVAQGLLQQHENQLRATPEGWLVLNHLLGEILI